MKRTTKHLAHIKVPINLANVQKFLIGYLSIVKCSNTFTCSSLMLKSLHGNWERAQIGLPQYSKIHLLFNVE